MDETSMQGAYIPTFSKACNRMVYIGILIHPSGRALASSCKAHLIPTKKLLCR